MLAVFLAFLVGGGAGFGVGAAAFLKEDAPPSSDEAVGLNEEPISEDPEPTFEEPPPEPDPDVEYESSCDYVLGDFSENSESGFRFIADAVLHNIGNIGTVNEVKVSWYLSGGDKITETKKVKVKAGADRRVGMSVPASQDEIDRHQSVSTESCEVTVTTVDVFGDPK